MTKRLYIINPASSHPHYSSYEVYKAIGLRPVIFTADQSTTTLAAMAPDDFLVTICDETVMPVDYETEADFICITGRISQWEAMTAHAAEFRKRGRTVIMGGPHVTLDPETARRHCDILVRGEIEAIYPEFFADLRAGKWKDDYLGERPDLSLAVIPDFDAYPNGHTLLGSIQTSRGCPFQCEFCSSAQYNGRIQRHKPIANIVRELDQLHALGYRTIFITDDNFTGNRSKVREVLEAFIRWNESHSNDRLWFIAQISVDAANDPALLEEIARAGVTDAFVGIETFKPESLKETRKLQNLNIDFKEQINRFMAAGISIQGGLIAGFDADGPDIFPLLFEFAQGLPIPYYSIDSLVALPGTPLYSRMAKEGRLLGETQTSGLPWSTNIKPAGMSQGQLRDGMQWLCSNLYHPRRFEERIHHFVDVHKPFPYPESGKEPPMDERRLRRYKRFRHNADRLLDHLAGMGPEEASMIERLQGLAGQRPEFAGRIRSLILDYVQTRHLYASGNFYDAGLAGAPFS